MMPNMPDMSNMPNMQQTRPSDLEGNNGRFNGNREMFGGNNGDFGGFGGFGGMGSSDVKLLYVDDNISSYSNIWNGAKTDITTRDQTRLIESLKKLANKEDLENVVDIEKVLRYFVVHNYVCNGDSYTGSMIHNYYLYEENGQLAILPWEWAWVHLQK